MGLAISVCAGIFLVTQNGVNTALKEAVLPNAFATGFVSFTCSLVFISTVAAVHKPCSGFSFFGAPWYAYTGGLLGPIYVMGAVVLADRLGFAVFQLCAIVGQLLVSLVCDGTGFLSDTYRVPSSARLVALTGIVCGTALTMGNGLATSALIDAPWYEAVPLAFSRPLSPASRLPLNPRCPPLSLALRYEAVPLLVGGCLSGSGMPIQALVNGVMTRHVGTPYRASTVSFTGGTLSLGLITLVIALSSPEPLVFKPEAGEVWMWRYFAAPNGQRPKWAAPELSCPSPQPLTQRHLEPSPQLITFAHPVCQIVTASLNLLAPSHLAIVETAERLCGALGIKPTPPGELPPPFPI